MKGYVPVPPVPDEARADFVALAGTQDGSGRGRAALSSLLERPDIDDVLAGALVSHPLRSAALTVVRDKVRRSVDADAAWPREAAHWLGLAGADWSTSAAFCAPLAWYARARRNSAVRHLSDPPRSSGRGGPGRSHDTVLRHLHLVGLRYDFRCRTMLDSLHRMPAGDAHSDPYTRSLKAFALLARSDPSGLAAAERSLAEAGDNLQVCHALLHGMWLGHDLPEQARHILDLAARPAFPPDDPIMLFRTATALRKLGRRREALAAIDDAVEGLDPCQPEVHADLVRERTLITAWD
ncbi:hypothetical protein [Streptomyces sp. NPDC005865]|uniref:hypothetical protein n=1 Tax=Streptomyces sp. NPDC005865 TaxID=3155453 RepID=UPI0033E42E96